MTGMQIGSALLLVMMLVYLLPRAKSMLKHSPKGSSSEWMTFTMLIGGVVLFVAILFWSMK